MGKLVYFYADGILIGKVRCNAYTARYVIRNMNIASIKKWHYEWG